MPLGLQRGAPRAFALESTRSRTRGRMDRLPRDWATRPNLKAALHIFSGNGVIYPKDVTRCERLVEAVTPTRPHQHTDARRHTRRKAPNPCLAPSTVPNDGSCCCLLLLQLSRVRMPPHHHTHRHLRLSLSLLSSCLRTSASRSLCAPVGPCCVCCEWHARPAKTAYSFWGRTFIRSDVRRGVSADSLRFAGERVQRASEVSFPSARMTRRHRQPQKHDHRGLTTAAIV